ncbi:MAG: BON domain-containing protein [Bdellovibrionales bacterium]
MSAAIRNRLIIDSKVDTKSVITSVYNGVAMHHGYILSYWKKRQLKNMTKKMPGVKGVSTASLHVKPVVVKSDENLRLEIFNIMESIDQDLKKTLEVKVVNGIVSLNGTAPTKGVVDLLENRIGKLQSVKQLRINSYVGIEQHRIDVNLSEYIETQLRNHQKYVKDLKISVRGRIAVIKGVVRSKLKALQIENYVLNLPEVSGVENKLKINPIT